MSRVNRNLGVTFYWMKRKLGETLLDEKLFHLKLGETLLGET